MSESSKEHPVDQPIKAIDIAPHDRDGYDYRVGSNAVVRIEATTKSGMYADIPYVRIWVAIPNGERCLAEFCQHNICGIYFE